jgi:hypothetical protein
MHPLDKREDDNVLELIRQKKHSGMALLYNTYGAAIYGVIIRIVEEKIIAEKIFSETMIRIYYHIDDFRPESSSFFTWMINLARTFAKDHIFVDGKAIEGMDHHLVFDLAVNKGLCVETVAKLLSIDKTACARELRIQIKTRTGQR